MNDQHDQIEDDDEADSAAAAFEDLRAEISVLRRAVEALPASLRENRPPDYAPTLGAIVKAIQGVEKRLAEIEGRPAIKVTPEQHEAVVLRRVGPGRNVARFYRMDIQADLFGECCFVWEWGRIGRAGQTRQIVYASQAEARAALERRCRDKENRGYVSVI